MQAIFIVAFCVIGQIYAAPASSNENNEIDAASFYYDGLSGFVALKLGHNCYLSSQEKNSPDIHTEEGLLAAESRIMILLRRGIQTPLSHAEVNQLSLHLERMCAGSSVYQLHHHHPPSTTMVSLI
ncbi:uncharacterized protein LOC110442639 [Mizuhopecten yessoensis]|uniref:Uncharacterized protein n=1 Tax=Mizuhopecten yessoensis TaxID=6573 RepID=A0A210PGU5_MIZYE|nr:uncharacterized protein LOC110442639 [Mizuhopecten yessoensis]OWF35676.1 hypothetical protein KP79_PYT04886 [Mizuhopecten yessoensis]